VSVVVPGAPTPEAAGGASAGAADAGMRWLLEAGFSAEEMLGQVEVAVQRPGARIEFGRSATPGGDTYWIRDNGAGFDMAYAAKLFGVFQRLHTVEEYEGTGIGLVTAHRVIVRHGGKTWAGGKVGEGATFCFTLGDDRERS
jgi:light-regulated signal transduction histidine kinase (bacteriophytochrome)